MPWCKFLPAETSYSNEQVVESNEQSHDVTTTFTTETKVQLQKYNDKGVDRSDYPVRDQAIADFMAKPWALATANWSTSSSANDVLYTLNIAPQLSIVSQWANKIQGYNLVRGTAVIRVVINANPFQQGKLLMSFVPIAQNITGQLSRTKCLNQKTQCPNVEIDCRDSTAILHIPYIAPTDFYSIADGYFDWGTMTLSVLSPLLIGGAGENTVQFTIFLSFEDFELAAPIVPQSGGAPKRKKASRPAKSVSSATYKESQAMSGGSVSRALSATASAAGYLAEIPMLSTVGGTAAWVLRGASKVASFFGWSKPQNDTVPCISARRLANFMPNSTGNSNAANLGLYHDAGVETMPDMAGNDMDEMSFNYLKGRKAYVTKFTWASTDVSGTTLKGLSVVPTTFYEPGVTTLSGTVANWASHTPFSYLSKFFIYWRGSIEITLKIVKTDFHSGRLLITFTPLNSPTTTPTVQSSILALREIVDIRTQSEIKLRLPYLLASKYTATNASSGILEVKVLNELKNPETCSSTVNILVYASAGPDFELANPGNLTTKPNITFVPQVGGVDPDTDQTIIDKTIGNIELPPLDTDYAAMCMGEMFTSIKQLMSRYSPIVTAGAITGSAAGAFGFAPFALPNVTLDPSGVLLKPIAGYDALAAFANGYAFYRGSVNVMTTYQFTGAQATTTASMQLYPLSGKNGAAIVDQSTSYNALFSNTGDPTGTFVGCQNSGIQSFDHGPGIMEAKVPYYCPMHMTPVDPLASTSAAPSGFADPASYLAISTTGGGSPTYKLYRSASDEYQLGYFLGFLPLFIDVT